MTDFTRGLTALAVAAALAVTGCSSSGTDSSTTTPPANTNAASSPAPSTSSAVSSDDLAAKLLTLDDLGGGFDQAQFQASNQPLPCTPDEPPLGEQVPDTAHAGTAFTHRTVHAALAEDLRFYSDDATAERAFTAATKGLDCASGTFNLTGTPTTFQFSDIQDVTSDTHADRAIAVEASSADVDVVLVGCQVGNAVLLLNFLKAPDAQTDTLPSPVYLATLAVTKVRLG
jgi:hypothetical protein